MTVQKQVVTDKLTSVKEAQEILQVSKKAIYDKLNKEELKDFVVKVKGVKYILPPGLKILKKNFGLSRKEDFETHFKEIIEIEESDSSKISNELDYKNELYKEFKDRIQFLEKENSKLLNIVTEQTTLLQNQNITIQKEQQLSLNHTELLLLEKRKELNLKSQIYQLEQEKKEMKGIKGFFRLFKK